MGAVVSQEHERPEGAYAKKSFETYSMAAVYRANARARLFLGEQLRRARQREALDTTARMELLHLLATNSTADDDSGADGDEVTAPVEARVVPSSPPAAEKEAAPVAKATRGGKSPDPTPKGSTEGTPKGSKDPTPKPSPVDSSKDNSSDDDAASDDDGPLKSLFGVDLNFSDFYYIFGEQRARWRHRTHPSLQSWIVSEQICAAVVVVRC